MSKKVSKNVYSADQIAKWDLQLDNCLFYSEQQGPSYFVVIGSVRYAMFTKKADCDNYIIALNSAIAPVKELISIKYASDQTAILNS